MYKRTFSIVLLVLGLVSVGCNSQSQLPEVSSGTLERMEFVESKYVTPRHIDVWLPPGYTPKKQYKVLYMHDGQMLFDAGRAWNGQEWGVDEVMGHLLQSGKIAETIVVGIHNISEERHSDYFPQKPFERLSKKERDSILKLKRGEAPMFGNGVNSDAYLKFIVEELKPIIDSIYSVKAGRENTFIAGSSMGGLISWYALCEYPEVFGGAACLSTHWPGTFTVENNPIPNAFLSYLKTNLPDPKTHTLYFDYGTETLDALYEPFQLQANEIMKTKGYNTKNWHTQKFNGEDHSENAWKKRLHIPLGFLLGN